MGSLAAIPGADPRDRSPRVLTLADATLLIVASVIGAGIFFTPAQVATLLPDARWYLMAWVVGALLSLAGALANAELGAMFPRAGGSYVFLREGLHPTAGFLTGWLSFVAIYAGTIAALAIAAAELVAAALGAGSLWVPPLAASGIGICSAIHARAVRWGAAANNLASLAKIAALLAFIGLGPTLGTGSFEPWLQPLAAADAPAPEGPLWLRFGRALSPVLFTYLGWNASVYVAGEIRDPQRNIPRSLFLGLGLCAGLYLLVGGVYLYALSPAELTASGDAGRAAAIALFGPVGGRWVAAFVLVSVLGTLHAMVLVGPRIAYAMALDRQFPAIAARLHPVRATPSRAIWVQAAIAIGLVFFLGTFPRALDFTVFAIVLATTADVAALFVLRWRRPDLVRPYRAWGYPWVPALYLGVHVAIGLALVVGSPREVVTTFVLLAAGLLLRRIGSLPR